jgi:hypothetical protein
VSSVSEIKMNNAGIAIRIGCSEEDEIESAGNAGNAATTVSED